MKRTNLVLDEKLLKQLVRRTGARTYSAAVMRAIEGYLRTHEVVELYDQLAGKGGWEGDLSVMRDDKPRKRRRTG